MLLNRRNTLIAGVSLAAIGFGIVLAPADELKKVTVVSSTAGVHAPFWIGIEKGFFKDAGFNVSWREVASSVDRVTVVSFGDAVMAGTGAQAMIAVMGQGTETSTGSASRIRRRTSPGLSRVAASAA